jgi:hypothetical protein
MKRKKLRLMLEKENNRNIMKQKAMKLLKQKVKLCLTAKAKK